MANRFGSPCEVPPGFIVEVTAHLDDFPAELLDVNIRRLALEPGVISLLAQKSKNAVQDRVPGTVNGMGGRRNDRL